MTDRFLPVAELDTLFDALAADGRRIIGPTVGDGAIVYEELDGAADLPWGRVVESAPGRVRLGDGDPARAFDYGLGVTAWKRFTHPPAVPGARFRREDDSLRVEAAAGSPPRLAFVGVRACEIAALRIQERVMRAGPLGDADHVARRAASLIVAVECARATDTCFCTSMEAGPEVSDGADIAMAEIAGGFLVRSGSAAGASIVEALDLRPATEAETAAAAAQVRAVREAIGDPVAAEGLPDRLRNALDSPRWAAIADRCLACANCTLVCPTCFCTSVAVASDLDGIEGTTERRWDSCFSSGFARVAGDASFRPAVADRYRQWMTHKFATWWDQFGMSGCVGCGRCIAWCPVAIDVREELAAVAPIGLPSGPPPWPASPGSGRAPEIGTTPPPVRAIARIRSFARETADTATIGLAITDPAILAAAPGQFVLVEQPAFAAPPISISRIRPDGLELTIRAAGPATARLIDLPLGTEVAVRGPLGRGWPISTARGRDVVIVAGGIGLAPLRPVLDSILAERPRFGAVRLYLGARSPADRLFVDELSALGGRADLEIAEIVDRAGGDWLGRIGVVTQLFDQAAWDGSRVTAFVCGPERMMRATAAALERLGVARDRTWVTLERNMACGVGTCGHCQLGPFFVCRDGPVFSLAELGDAFMVEGL
ncbi:MAG TPA: 4Fe-4S dicluster domain-containing protein [Candidatus Limnocylindrales bacterium]|nr:4Fe-4S dicluster domain-containing protein [Candidatus Limnocylindrales bacterium]